MPERKQSENELIASLKVFGSRISGPARAKAELPFIPLPESNKVFEITELLSQSPLTNDRVLYIHLPFCNQNCTFCGYYKEIHCGTGLIDKYIRKITGQLELLNSYPWFKEKPFHAIYFGGGSPASLSTSQLTFLMEAVHRFIPQNQNTELTVETTVNEVNQTLVNNLVQLGINRMSIGVQSFNTTLRQSVGRISDRQKVIESIQSVHSAGITNLCIDLIYNLPGQKIESWEDDLQILGELPVTGCSVYPLIPFPDSTLVRSGNFIQQTVEDAFKYFTMADDFLLSLNNWTAFTPVQYGHVTAGEPKYIKAQGQQSDLLALGPSAGGRINEYQYLSKYSLETCLSAGFNFLLNSSWSSVHKDYISFRHLFSLSEGAGILTNEFLNLGQNFLDLVKGLLDQNLIKHVDNKYVMTSIGRFWAGNISQLICHEICKVFNKY